MTTYDSTYYFRKCITSYPWQSYSPTTSAHPLKQNVNVKVLIQSNSQVKNFINANKYVIKLYEGIASTGTSYGSEQDNEFRFEVNDIHYGNVYEFNIFS